MCRRLIFAGVLALLAVLGGVPVRAAANDGSVQTGTFSFPVTGAPTQPAAGSPPPLPPKSEPFRKLVAILLSVGLGLFLADAVASLMDSSLVLFCDIHALTLTRGILGLFALLAGIAIYGLIGFVPMVPKRLFLPVTLFNPVALLAVVPFFIYFHGRNREVDWVVSTVQVILGLGILHAVQGGFRLRWPLMGEKQLKARRFSWKYLLGFLLANAFLLLPVIMVCLFLCAALAADHFSEGFLALRPGGLAVRVRKYTRSDGKTIELFPMAHIADADFYRRVAGSFPTNSIILMEGVTDTRNLLTNKISYKRMAASLGVAAQEKEFRPSQGEMVRADVDVEQFGTNTIDLLNLVMLFHSRGVNAGTLLEMMKYSPPPHFEEQLMDDLLRKRNRRLLEEIHSRLSQSEHLVVPWGVAHMPELAKEIQKSGFRLEDSREYVVIRFRQIRK